MSRLIALLSALVLATGASTAMAQFASPGNTGLGGGNSVPVPAPVPGGHVPGTLSKTPGAKGKMAEVQPDRSAFPQSDLGSAAAKGTAADVRRELNAADQAIAAARRDIPQGKNVDNLSVLTPH